MILYQELRSGLGQQRDRLAEDIAACEGQIQFLEIIARQGIMSSMEGLECSFALTKNQKTIEAHKRHLHGLRKRQARILWELNRIPEPYPKFDLASCPDVSLVVDAKL